MTQIRNYTKDCFDYFTNGGSGVDLLNLVSICEKKKMLERVRATEERESLRKERGLEKRESYREREERELTEDGL